MVQAVITYIKKLLRKKPKKIAIHPDFVVSRSSHQISNADISTNALSVLQRLHKGGFEAYLVGGSVRDLIAGKAPKDFDIATNASPGQIKRLFRNARIIGRRFKLAHILFHREIIEVATFRTQDVSHNEQQVNEQGMLVRDNVFGTLEEDAWRRDFTINSLYYHGEDGTVIDLTGGVSDIHSKTIRLIGDPTTRYQEDPVRMLRAIRFSAKLHFEIEKDTLLPILKLAETIKNVSNSRLFDEIVKLYQCGESVRAHDLMVKYNLFECLFPDVYAVHKTSSAPLKELINIALQNTDARIHAEKPVTPAFLFAVFLWFPMLAKADALKKAGIEPLPALEQAMSGVIGYQSRITSIPKRLSQIIREIWLLQHRLTKRTGIRPFKMLEHPRFRAAYDFLALRAVVGDASVELVDWWTIFQEVEKPKQQKMISNYTKNSRSKQLNKL